MKKRLTKVGLLIIGDEILQGRRVDKHFPHVRDYLSELGVDVAWVYWIGDDADLLVEHFEAIRRRGDTCFSFGGIGATPDDLTRQAVAQAYGVDVVPHPEAVRLIENQFGEGAYPNRILMAELPEGAELVPNQFNNIPGFSMGEIYCLPGFPEMAWPMIQWIVRTCYDVSQNPENFFQSFLVPGARESELITLLEETQNRFGAVKISSLPRFPKEGGWQVELGVRGQEELVVQAVDVLQAELIQRGHLLEKKD
jgi:molybdopterin-biosynthesis enzyme MoeA-like protein